MAVVQQGSHTHRLEGTELFTSLSIRAEVTSCSCFNFANFTLQIRHVPSIYSNRSHVCIVHGRPYRRGRKSAEFLPPTHICGFNKPQTNEKQTRCWRVRRAWSSDRPSRRKGRLGVTLPWWSAFSSLKPWTTIHCFKVLGVFRREDF